jgi:micrococcal nuclease
MKKIGSRYFLLVIVILIQQACQTNPGIQPTESNNTGPTYDCVPQNTHRDLAELVRVIDGDTIEVVVNGETRKVRYIGMDTPEREDDFFAEATNANAQLITGQTLTLVKDVSETDRYDRLLRYVFVGEHIFVNYELVKQGYAQIVTYPPDVACEEFFREAQTNAREQELGLWGLTQ